MMDYILNLLIAMFIKGVVSILGSALAEATPLWLLRLAEWRLPSEQRPRYHREWRAELDMVAKKSSKKEVLQWALQIWVRAGSTARAIGPAAGRNIAEGVGSSAGTSTAKGVSQTIEGGTIESTARLYPPSVTQTQPKHYRLEAEPGEFQVRYDPSKLDWLPNNDAAIAAVMQHWRLAAPASVSSSVQATLTIGGHAPTVTISKTSQ